MRVGRMIAVMLGGLLALAGFGALAGGGALVAVHSTQRDSAGFLQTPATRVETSTAVLTAAAELGPPTLSQNYPLGTVRIRAQSAGAAPIFVGIARRSDVDTWLSGVTYAEVSQVNWGPAVATTRVNGSRDATPPGASTIWVASAVGTGRQSLTWPSETGDWAVVVMNADARPGVAADVSVGTDTGLLLPAGLISAFLGLLLLGAGAALLVLGVRPLSTEAGVTEGAPAVPGSYPVRLDARLDPALSRWLWLVKWLLAIPHYIILAFLWLAAVPLTVIAGIAILITGRYPRSIFEFNVGVMRWTWRVSYYTFSALGTDRYPPFQLERDPSYPADLAIDYPQRLSRGLVLVKWWLLAIPHYLVVALLAGGWTRLGVGDDRWSFGLSGLGGGGLIGIIVLVAAIVLAVTGAYPAALFDVVMGMNRWCYRVFAYAGLMRDEYPPFRFDSGGADPGTVPAPPPPEPIDGSGTLVSVSSDAERGR